MSSPESIEQDKTFRSKAEVNDIKLMIAYGGVLGDGYHISFTDGDRNLGVSLNRDTDPQQAFKKAVELALEAKDISDLQLKLTLALSKE